MKLRKRVVFDRELRLYFLPPPSPHNTFSNVQNNVQRSVVNMSGTQSQIEKAIGQIKDKAVVPEIDFTQHQLENGMMVSTQERVVKEVCFILIFGH